MIFASKDYKETKGTVVDTWKTAIQPNGKTAVDVEAGCHCGTMNGDDHIYFRIAAKDKNAFIAISESGDKGFTCEISGMNRFDVADALKFIVMVIETQED